MAVRLSDLFAAPKPIIGPVQLLPLPGSPGFAGSVDAVVDAAIEDALALAAGGVDGLILENMGDAPFFTDQVPPETVASIGRVAAEVRTALPSLPLGVNVLRNAARASLAIAHAHGGSYIRVNVLTESFVTDQGLIEGAAADLLRARRLMDAGAVAILADVHVKHAAPLLARSIRESALDMIERGGADVLVVSGTRTGSAADLADVEGVRGLGADVILGSGVDPANAAATLTVADGAVVASAFRPGGDLSKRVDRAMVERFMAVVGGVRDAGA
jgi:membrane complex biogenesis BtpA family protein